MQYRIEKTSYGSCLFCKRGELSKSKQWLKYPYKKIFVICGNSLEIRLCKQCLDEVKRIGK